MNVLVTGGAGYIGGHMVLALLDAGHRPVVFDNLSTGFRWSVPRRASRSSSAMWVTTSWCCARCRSTASTPSPISPPSWSCRESVSDPLGYYLNNTVKSRSLMAAAVAAGIDKVRLLIDRRRLRQHLRQADRRGHAARAPVALWQLEAAHRGDAARRGRRPQHALRGAALLQRGRLRPRRCATGSRRRTPPT